VNKKTENWDYITVSFGYLYYAKIPSREC